MIAINSLLNLKYFLKKILESGKIFGAIFQVWEILQRVFLYLATLPPQKRALSTYFAATADGVGGGGPSKKPTT